MDMAVTIASPTEVERSFCQYPLAHNNHGHPTTTVSITSR